MNIDYLKNVKKQAEALYNHCYNIMVESDARLDGVEGIWPKTKEENDAVCKATKALKRLSYKSCELEAHLDDIIWAIDDAIQAEERLRSLPLEDEDEDDSSKKGGTK